MSSTRTSAQSSSEVGSSAHNLTAKKPSSAWRVSTKIFSTTCSWRGLRRRRHRGWRRVRMRRQGPDRLSPRRAEHPGAAGPRALRRTSLSPATTFNASRSQALSSGLRCTPPTCHEDLKSLGPLLLPCSPLTRSSGTLISDSRRHSDTSCACRHPSSAERDSLLAGNAASSYLAPDEAH